MHHGLYTFFFFFRFPKKRWFQRIVVCKGVVHWNAVIVGCLIFAKTPCAVCSDLRTLKLAQYGDHRES